MRTRRGAVASSVRRRRLLIVLGSVVGLAVLLTVLNLFSFWQINGESGTFSMLQLCQLATAKFWRRASPTGSAILTGAR